MSVVKSVYLAKLLILIETTKKNRPSVKKIANIVPVLLRNDDVTYTL